MSPVSRRSRGSKAGKRPMGSEPVSKGDAKVRSARDPERELHGDATSGGFPNASRCFSLGETSRREQQTTVEPTYTNHIALYSQS